MPIHEFFQALPGAVLYGLLPGFLAATCLAPRWRWWERLAASPGLAAGLAGLWGAVLHDVRVPFDPATYLPLVVLLAATAWWRRRRAEGVAHRETHSTTVVAAAALAAGVIAAGVAAWSFRGELVPVQTDAPVHAQMVKAIAQTHDVLPPIPEPVDQSAWVRPRMGFEAVAALTASTGGPSPTGSMLPVTLLAVALIPLSLAALALEATGDRLIAALAPVLGLGMAFPSNQLTFGEFPMIVDSTLVVPAILSAVRAVRGIDLRDHLAMLTAVASAIWVVHGLEAITAAVIGGPFLLATLASRRPAQWRTMALVVMAVLAGAVVGVVVVRVPTVPIAVGPPGGGAAVPGGTGFVGLVAGLGPADVVRTFLGLALPTNALAVPLLVGGAVAFLERRLRCVVLTSGLLFLVFADVLTTARLRWLWTRLFPWAVTDRVAGLQYWLMPLLVALGMVWVGTALARGVSRPQARPLAALCLVAVVAIGAVVAGGRRDHDVYAEGIAQASVVTATDLRAFAQLDALYPNGVTILTDGLNDAGQWIGALTRQTTYFSKGYLAAHPNDVLLQRLRAETCGAQLGADMNRPGLPPVLFVGSRPLDAALRPDTTCLDRQPWLREIVAAGVGREAVAYAVSRAG